MWNPSTVYLDIFLPQTILVSNCASQWGTAVPKIGSRARQRKCLEKHARHDEPSALLEWVNKWLHGLSPRANYTGRATVACRRSDCQHLRLSVPRGQRDGYLREYSRFSRQESLLFLSSSSSIVLTRLSGPRSISTTFFLVVLGLEPGPRDL
jgi:hypothetical protein